MGKLKGMNRHQKAAFKMGERRLAPQEIPELLEMSSSSDPEDRLMAAENLCPCHVRRRVEPVWEALYQLMTDPDVRVRRAAWHTIEDGGRPNDPQFDTVLDHALAFETDRTVRTYLAPFASQRRADELNRMKCAAKPAPVRRGKCDFCGESNISVVEQYQVEIPSDSGPRPALSCDACEASVA